MRQPERIPPDCDLRDVELCPVDVDRFNRACAEGLAGPFVRLHLAAWQQVPAGTLPSGRAELARIAMVEAHRAIDAANCLGWFIGTDGRLHHDGMRLLVLAAWREKRRRQVAAERKASGKPAGSKRCPGDFNSADAWRVVEAMPERDKVAGLVHEQWLLFVDHEFRRPISDWPAAWRNWLRKAMPSRAGRAPDRVDRQLSTAGLMVGAKPARPVRALNPDEVIEDATPRRIAR